MKRILLILIPFILLLVSCEKSNSGDELDPGDSLITEIPDINDLILKIGENMGYAYADIHLYDSSTHIFYFKDLHPEFEKIKQDPFQLYVKGDTIYQGDFWPAFLSSLPPGPYIPNYPLFYQTYALRVDIRRATSSVPDPRNDPRLIGALKDKGILHSGLAVRITSVIPMTSHISFKFEITNYDKDNLLVLDPDKTGMPIFHYFTNGLYIRKLPGTATTNVKIASQTPSPWNGWHQEWFSMISPGASKAFVIDYPIDTPLTPGEYEIKFEYPGLSYQVYPEQLYQTSGRIWLGSVTGFRRIVVN